MSSSDLHTIRFSDAEGNLLTTQPVSPHARTLWEKTYKTQWTVLNVVRHFRYKGTQDGVRFYVEESPDDRD